MNEPFSPRLLPRWSRTQVGGGRMILHPQGLRLAVAGVRRAWYANAQLDDYGPTVGRPGWLPRGEFGWRPPLRLSLYARASGPLLGTAGFGFWNNPFSPLGTTLALPATLWFFFASAPADMPLAYGVSGNGWKAATLDATQPRALAWAPLTPAVLLLNRYPAIYRQLWPRVQRALRIAEATIPAVGPAWRRYTIEWWQTGARFLIDNTPVLVTNYAPRGPLGFVAWVDNQWAVATPWGQFGWGRLDIASQWLDLAELMIEPLARA